MALINLGNDPWLLEYDASVKLQRDIMEQLSLRSKELRTTDNYSRLSASIRLRLKQYGVEVDQLKVKLDQESKNKTITYEESERRSRQVETLKSKFVVMTKMFETKAPFAQSNVYSADRAQLMGVTDLGTSDWGANDEDDELLQANIASSSIPSIQQQQQEIFKDQDAALEELAKSISRQKNIAHSISNEVDLHNEILDDLGEHIQRTDIRVSEETSHVQIVQRKDKTCGLWIVIILLFIAIITVATAF